MAAQPSSKKPKKGEDLKGELVKNLRHDRDRLSGYIDAILDAAVAKASEDPYAMVNIAEYIAKLSDALTRQNSLLLNTVGLSMKQARGEDDSDEFAEIGHPFGHTAEDGDGAN